LNGFNAAEIEKFLAQGVDAKTQVYKPQTGGEGAKSVNPWGAKRESEHQGGVSIADDSGSW
jgi:hypothetical protein